MEIRFIDLFAGVGGFHYGLENANFISNGRSQKVKKGTLKGFRYGLHALFQEEIDSKTGWDSRDDGDQSSQRKFTCVYSNEYDKYANSVYKKHFGECDERDIRTVPADEIPDHDLLCGGFPCQAFSVAGNRGGFNDTRGTLFFEIARIAKQKQPRFLLLENVKGLLSHDKGRTFGTIINTLDELGYDCQWQVLNSKNFGVPQNRERVFIVGHLRGTPRPKVFPLESFNPKTLEFLGGILNDNAKMWLENGKQFSRNFPQGSRVYKEEGIAPTLASNAGGLGAKTGLYAVKVDHEGGKRNIHLEETPIANTLTATSYKGVNAANRNIVGQEHSILMYPHGGNPGGRKKLPNLRAHSGAIHNEPLLDNKTFKIRKLTPIECERLQGFPDNWTKCGYEGQKMSDTQRYKMMGNAVTTNVITVISTKLLNSINA